MSDEMITVAARIPLKHYRELKTMMDNIDHYGFASISDVIRAAVAEFVHNHQPGETS